jgi:hypothetical protein
MVILRRGWLRSTCAAHVPRITLGEVSDLAQLAGGLADRLASDRRFFGDIRPDQWLAQEPLSTAEDG